MVYWEFLVAGILEFTQVDSVVAEKHSGLQRMGGNFDKTCGKRVKLDQKSDEIGYHRDQNRITGDLL